MKYEGYYFKIRPKQPAFDEALSKYHSAGSFQNINRIQHQASASLVSRDIFLVHGHNNELKETVARFLEKIKLIPIILHEQVNAGRTIIEKFEEHSKTGFAVILITNDDFGGKVGEESPQPRARQNVIFEHGYFLGKLGRSKVCALHMNGVELPSDLSGVLYIPLDDEGAWKFKLAKEIRESGIEVDMNLL